MKTFFTLSLALVMLNGIVSATGTCGTSCQLAKKNNCYEPKRCSLDRYLLNPDYFTVFVKNDIFFERYTLSEFNTELKEMEEEYTTPWGTFISSLSHYKENSLEIEEVNQSKEIEIISEFGPAFRKYRTENYSSYSEREETYERFEGSDYSHSITRDPLQVLGIDLTSSVGLCASYFLDNFDDRTRDLALYPSNCHAQCMINYQVNYAIWGKVVKYLLKKIQENLSRVSNCSRRKLYLLRWLRDACRPYPPGVYRLFRDYLNFIWLERICDPDWFPIH